MNYWWIVDYVTKDNGKIQPILLGNRGFLSEDSAEDYLSSIQHTQGAKIMELPTRNPAKASQFIRGKLTKTEGTSAALTRVKHQKMKRSSEDEEATLKRKRFSRARAAGRRSKPRKPRVSRDSRLAIR